MIMYDLVTGTRSEVRSEVGIVIIKTGPYYTSDFWGVDGTRMVVFWTVNARGQVAIVLEHTMTYATSFAPTGDVRLMNA